MKERTKSGRSKRNRKKSGKGLYIDKLKPFDRGDYIWGDVLGQGSFGKVISVFRKSDGLEMACKIIDTKAFSRFLKKQLGTEIEVMTLHSKGSDTIATLYSANKNDDEVALFIEKCEGGSLQDGLAMQDVTQESDVKIIIRQLLEALEYIHSHKVAHMDLKPENICFLKQQDPKHRVRLLDFGLTVKRTKKLLKGTRGTRPYMAPEVLTKTGYSEQADMWSIGVIMFELLTGEKPFKTLWGKKISAKKAKKVMSVKKISKERWEMMSKEAQTVIEACCRYESATRPTPNDLLNYPWFTSAKDVKLNAKTVERFETFAQRGALQRCLTPLMMAHVKDVDENLINFARNLHKNTAGDANEFNFEEFKLCMAQLEEHNWSEQELLEIFQGIDEDGSGAVCLQEMLTWFSWDYVMKQDERMWDFVKTLTDEDGFIDMNVLKEKIKSTHPEWEKYTSGFESLFDPEKSYSKSMFANIMKVN